MASKVSAALPARESLGQARLPHPGDRGSQAYNREYLTSVNWPLWSKGKRPAFVWRAGVPRSPDARNAHDGFVPKEVDLKRAFPVAGLLPLVEPAYYAGRRVMPNRRAIRQAVKDRLGIEPTE